MSDQSVLETRVAAALAGRYELIREVGEGGMAIVYLATDLKHDRSVALKVLRPELAAVIGAERFLGEIKTTANLHHPHILPLHDSGEADGLLYYVTPYIEGESLRDRIDHERQLPVDEAVRIATAVAQALQHAHDRGIVHRDIKPANILLQDGQPIVADFGIAIAVGLGGGERLTETGLSLGTPYYMSPEQATGDQAVGPRSDVYSLAAVLYEALTGEPPYPGTTAQAVLGRIISGGPASAREQRATVPRNVDAAIRKSLEMLPADRFGSAEEFARALDDRGYRYGVADPLAAGATLGRWRYATIVGWVAAAVLAAALLWPSGESASAGALAQFEDPLPSEHPLGDTHSNDLGLSPDGSQLAYNSSTDPTNRLMLRRWDDTEARPLLGTERGAWPAFSPDGRWLAFRQDAQIKVVSIVGPPGARTLGQGTGPIVWGPGDLIYFVRGGVTWRVPAEGGEAEQVTHLGEGETQARVTDILPGGERALVGVRMDGRREIRSLDLASGDQQQIQAGGYEARYADGVLLYLDNSAPEYLTNPRLMAVRFDPDRGVLGDPVVLDGEAEGEAVEGYSLAASGTLFYPVRPARPDYTPAWVERDGTWTPVEAGWAFRHSGSDFSIALSDQGDRMAVSYGDPGTTVYIKDLPAGGRYALTAGVDGSEYDVAFSPDGRSILFSGANPDGGPTSIHLVRLDNPDRRAALVSHDQAVLRGRYAPSARSIVYSRGGGVGDGGSWDLYFVPLDDAGVPRMSEAVPFLDTERDEVYADFSPDERWIAYVQTPPGGERNVFVRPFPDVNSPPVQISESGGRGPVWSPVSNELFYVDAENWMTAVEFGTSSGEFRVESRTPLFELDSLLAVNNTRTLYDVTPDGRRFLMFARVSPRGERRDVLVMNFAEKVTRLAGM